jgi:hypothetical protein
MNVGGMSLDGSGEGLGACNSFPGWSCDLVCVAEAAAVMCPSVVSEADA